MKALEALMELIYPPSLYCVCCGNIIDGSRSYSLCDHCIQRIKWTMDEQSTSGGLRLITCCEYGIYERSLIFALKYNGKRNVARNIADIMADRWRAGCATECAGGSIASGEAEMPGQHSDTAAPEPCGAMEHVIVPVPIHPKKRRERGFDQMELISKHLSENLGIPRSLCLERTRETLPMRGLGPEERRANVSGSFRMRPGADRADIAGKRVILIDDFCTTGSTADACAEALMPAGPKEVILFTFAARLDRGGDDMV